MIHTKKYDVSFSLQFLGLMGLTFERRMFRHQFEYTLNTGALVKEPMSSFIDEDPIEPNTDAPKPDDG